MTKPHTHNTVGNSNPVAVHDTVSFNDMDSTDGMNPLEDGVMTRYELDVLSDDNLIEVSHAFGSDYADLVKGGADTEFQKVLADKVAAVLEPLLDKIKGLEGHDLAKIMIETYRSSGNAIYAKYAQQQKFANEQVSDEELSHVTRVAIGPFGIPVIYTDGRNDELLGTSTMSFASAEPMIEAGLPPLVVINELYTDAEKHEVTTHETAHAIFALLRQTGVIPNPDGEGLTVPGQKSAFELARDEATAQMVANQTVAKHSGVIAKMNNQKIDEATISEYHAAFDAFDKATAEKAGMRFSDGILGVLMSKNFGELNAHMSRMGKISHERIVARGLDDTPQQLPPPKNTGWSHA
ncbi:MAG: hypothetical protein JWN75_990 [Candidatus Saccharibacteria bacterium]|nr:hypothetical protein [Candidatus Saccharibacteria bacterium]